MILNRLGAVCLIVALPLVVNSAQADDNNCTVAGLVQGGGLLDQETQTANSTFADGIDWTSGFGEAALNYGCDVWRVQIDTALYSFSENETPYQKLTNGHVGGAAFWRDSDLGAIGVAGSHVNQHESFLTVATSASQWRMGGFAELYLNESLTFGGGAHYLTGDAFWYGTFETQPMTGFEGELYAKFYPTDNLALNVRGDFTHQRIDVGTFIVNVDGLAVSGDVEYLIPQTALSVFAGARFATQDIKSFSDSKQTDTQEYVGLRFAFGSNAPASLRDRDRHGTYDNTSVFQEKIPSLVSSLPGS